MELFKKVLYFCGSVLVLASVSLCQTGLSGAEEEDILLRHNNFRSSVSPSAANMERMVRSFTCMHAISLSKVDFTIMISYRSSTKSKINFPNCKANT